MFRKLRCWIIGHRPLLDYLDVHTVHSPFAVRRMRIGWTECIDCKEQIYVEGVLASGVKWRPYRGHRPVEVPTDAT